MELGDEGLHRGRGDARMIEIMGLGPDGVDRRARCLDRLDDGDEALVVRLPLDVVVVVENQDRVGTRLASPGEGIRDPLPVAVRSATDGVGVARSGMRRGLIDDIDQPRLWIAGTELL